MEIARHPSMFGAGLMTNIVLNCRNYDLGQIRDVWKSQGTQEYLDQD